MGRQPHSSQGCTQPSVPHKLPAGVLERLAAGKRARNVHSLTIKVCIAEHVFVHHLHPLQLFRAQTFVMVPCLLDACDGAVSVQPNLLLCTGKRQCRSGDMSTTRQGWERCNKLKHGVELYLLSTVLQHMPAAVMSVVQDTL